MKTFKIIILVVLFLGVLFAIYSFNEKAKRDAELKAKELAKSQEQTTGSGFLRKVISFFGKDELTDEEKENAQIEAILEAGGDPWN